MFDENVPDGVQSIDDDHCFGASDETEDISILLPVSLESLQH
jgi:hypothetical protein